MNPLVIPSPANTGGAALREEFAWRGRLPMLLASALAFGLSAPWISTYLAWQLALSLWLGYCVAYATLAFLGFVTDVQRWPAVFVLVLPSLLFGMSVGLGAEHWLGKVHGEFWPGIDVAHAWLHLAFSGLLMLPPLAQAAVRQRALRKLEAERARVQAELLMLQAQIEPHFLFNTLATLRSLVRQQSANALPLLDAISGFLEAVLPQVRETDSTLGRELEIVDQYLGIMAMRVGPRLKYRLDVDAALQAMPLPPFLLQPLVENAIVHGIEPSEAGGSIVVQACVQGQRLALTVSNTGAPLGTAPASAGHGLALRNLRRRLHALYSDGAGFLLQQGEHRTEAVLTLPLPAELRLK